MSGTAYRQIGLMVGAVLLSACAATTAPPVSPATVPPSKAAAPVDSHYLTAADRYVSIDGVRYRVREEGPADAPAIILIHGFTFSLESWDAWAADLSRDHRVIRFDLAGHGLSSPDPAGRYDSASRISRILALLDRLGIRHATIAGNSYGGLLAWNIAAQYSQRVDRLILVDSAAFSINGVTEKPAVVPLAMRAYLLDPQPDHVRASAGLIFAHPEALSAQRLAMMHDMIARPGNGPALVAHLEQFTLPQPDAALSHIKTRTLILWGKMDRVVPVEQAQRLHSAITGSQLIIYDDVGHAPQEEAAARSIADVRHFLSESK